MDTFEKVGHSGLKGRIMEQVLLCFDSNTFTRNSCLVILEISHNVQFHLQLLGAKSPHPGDYQLLNDLPASYLHNLFFCCGKRKEYQ